jgi:hypothetical protein
VAALLLAACAPRSPQGDRDSGRDTLPTVALPESSTRATSPPRAAPATSAVPLPDGARDRPAGVAGDSGAIARLEREARALAHTEGCSAAARCRTAPLGHRACGGPRDYIAYCAATTDSAALYRALDRLARAEEAEQRRTGMASTCEFRTPPAVSLAAGRCAISTGGPRTSVP